MTLLPSDTAFADGTPISKSAVRALFSQRMPTRVANAAELRAITTGAANTFLIGALKQFWFYDSTDTTSADDGVTVIISADGYRYKPITPSVAAGSIGTAQIANSAVGTAQLAASAVTFAKIDPAAIAADADAQAGIAANLLMTPETTAAAIAAQAISEKVIGYANVTSPQSSVVFTIPALASGAYRLVRIAYWNLLAASNADLQVVFSSDGGSTFYTASGAYAWTCTNTAGSTAFNPAIQLTVASNNGVTGAGIDFQATHEASGVIDFFDLPTNGTRKSVSARGGRLQASGAPLTESSSGQFLAATTAINAIKLQLGAGSVQFSKGIFLMTGVPF